MINIDLKFLNEKASEYEQQVNLLKGVTALLAELDGLCKKHNHESLEAFLSYLESIKQPEGHPQKRSAATEPQGRKATVRLAADQKNELFEDLKKGNATGAELAEKYGVTIATVQSYKKKLGLVKERAKDAPPKA